MSGNYDKINILGHLSLKKETIKKIFDKILLANNITHALKKELSKIVHNRRFQIIHFEIARILHYLNF